MTTSLFKLGVSVTTLLTVALCTSACTLTTAGTDSATSRPPATQSTTSLDDPTVPADLTMQEIFDAFEEEGLIPEGELGELAVDGFATQGLGWTAGTGSEFVDVYEVDADAASPEVLANYDRAVAEGQVLFDTTSIPIDGVRGRFMVNLSAGPDPDELLKVWNRVTTVAP